MTVHSAESRLSWEADPLGRRAGEREHLWAPNLSASLLPREGVCSRAPGWDLDFRLWNNLLF